MKKNIKVIQKYTLKIYKNKNRKKIISRVRN